MFDDLNFSLDMSQSELDGYLMNRESRIETPSASTPASPARAGVVTFKPAFRASVAAWIRRLVPTAASFL